MVQLLIPKVKAMIQQPSERYQLYHKNFIEKIKFTNLENEKKLLKKDTHGIRASSI